MGGTDLEVRRIVSGQPDLLGSWRLQASDEVELTTEARETPVSPAASHGEPQSQLVYVVTITGRDEDVVAEAEVWPGTMQKARGEEGERIVEVASKDAQAKADADAEAAEVEPDVVVPADAGVPTVEAEVEEGEPEAEADEGEGADVGTGPYEGRSNDQLRALAAERGLATSGNKDELIERLRA